jgi:hypothetical protein
LEKAAKSCLLHKLDSFLEFQKAITGVLAWQKLE